MFQRAYSKQILQRRRLIAFRYMTLATSVLEVPILVRMNPKHSMTSSMKLAAMDWASLFFGELWHGDLFSEQICLLVPVTK